MALLEQMILLVPLLSPFFFSLFVIGMQLARQLAAVPHGLVPSHLIDQRLLQELLITSQGEKPY